MFQRITRDNIKKQYAQAFLDLRNAGNALLVAVIIFLAGILIGLNNPSWGDDLISAIKGIARQISGEGTLLIIISIFVRNSLSAAISVISGPLLGIIPVFGAVTNGLLLGAVFSHLTAAERINAMLLLVPHGIFELPAISAAWGLGIWQGIWYFERGPKQTFRERRGKAFSIFFTIILPLLLIAATIEGISIAIMKM
ncbi:MAG: stage II sporulation protein M [Thermodesulfovibrionales bacterium]